MRQRVPDPVVSEAGLRRDTMSFGPVRPSAAYKEKLCGGVWISSSTMAIHC